jgi:hypothetical protein
LILGGANVVMLFGRRQEPDRRGSVPRAGPRVRVVPRCEQLEGRWVPATLRVVTYNIEADINGVTTPRPGLYEVLEGIGEEKVQGNYQPLDILLLQETTSNTTTVDPIVSNLNSYYGGLAVYARSPYQATQSGSNSFGNGPNALVYNTTTLNLVASVGVGTPQGSGNGEYRQVVRYEFQPVGFTGSNGVFYVYTEHAKAGTASSDFTARNEEAQIVRNDEATLPAGAFVLYTGDLNTTSSSDASYQTLTAATSPGGVAQGAGSDPINRPGNWDNNSAFQDILSESSTNLRYRDDHEVATQNVLTSTPGGINYVAGSYHTFGVNGSTPVNGSVNNGSDTALNSDLVQDGPTFIPASTLYADLTTASDHLPVVADYSLVPFATTMAINAPAISYGANGSVTVTVTSPGGTVTGNVSLAVDGGSPTTLALSGGSSVFTVNNPAVGSHRLFASYAAQGGFAASSATGSLVVTTINGLLQFSAASYAATYGAGPVTLTITRSGGTSGAVSLQYYTADGSAVSGTDYTGVPQSSPQTVAFADGQTTAAIKVPIANPTSIRGSRSFSVVLENPAGGATLGSQTTAAVNLADPPLQVTSAALSGGNEVTITFNRAPDPTRVQLYTAAGGFGGPNLTLTGAGTGPVQGSLVFNPTNPTQVLFVKTAGLLAADTYTLTLLGTGQVLVWRTGNGQALNGGANYTNNTLTVAGSALPTLAVPSFARGAGQAVNVPAAAPTGIPVTIRSAANVRSAGFTLTYDPTLLTIAPTGALSLAPAAAATGLTLSYGLATVDANHARLAVTISGGSGWSPADGTTLLNIAASVPTTAPYANKAVLDLGSVLVNGTAGVGVSGVESAAYVGDTDGSTTYSGQDTSLISQVVVGLGTGFARYKDLDPLILADVDGDGSLSGQDASELSRAVVGLTVPDVPPLPAGVTLPAGGPDPRLYFAAAAAVPGQTITVALRLGVTQPGGIDVASLTEAIRFDPAVLSVANVRTGPLLPGFVTTATVDNAAGTVRVSQSAPAAPLSLADGSDGVVLLLDVTARPGAAPGATALNLAQEVSDDGGVAATAVSDGHEALRLDPAPTDGAADARVDGTFTVTAPVRGAGPGGENDVPLAAVNPAPTSPGVLQKRHGRKHRKDGKHHGTCARLQPAPHRAGRHRPD